MRLFPRSPQSYTTECSPSDVATWLESRGFVRTRPTSSHEYTRLALRPPRPQRDWNAVCVVYHSGTVLLQGTESGIAAMQHRIAPAIEQEVTIW
jgi:hypothetical protein